MYVGEYMYVNTYVHTYHSLSVHTDTYRYGRSVHTFNLYQKST